MYTTRESIRYVHPFLQRILHILNHTPTLEQLLLHLRHPPFQVIPPLHIQRFLRFEESRQLLFIQQISCFTHEYNFEIHDQIFQRPVVLHIPRGKEDIFEVSFAVAYSMQLEPVKQPLSRPPTSSYLFCYSILIYIMVLAYWYIRRVYKMLIITTTVCIKQILYQQANEQTRMVRRFQEVLVIRLVWEIPSVVCPCDSMNGLLILYPHIEPHQVESHHFGQHRLHFRSPFLFQKISKLLPERKMKKSLKKVINEYKKNSKFFIIHIQLSNFRVTYVH